MANKQDEDELNRLADKALESLSRLKRLPKEEQDKLIISGGVRFILDGND